MTGKRTIRFRLLRDDRVAPTGDPSAPFGLQDKDENLHPPIRRRDGVHVFDLELAVSEGPDGRPNFTGPFAFGPRDQRFVNLSWPRLDGGGYVNRIKVRLTDLDWPLIEKAIAGGVALEADTSSRKPGGGMVAVSWRLGDG
jgi:hypothetical protein